MKKILPILLILSILLIIPISAYAAEEPSYMTPVGGGRENWLSPSYYGFIPDNIDFSVVTSGSHRLNTHVTLKLLFRCADGYIISLYDCYSFNIRNNSNTNLYTVEVTPQYVIDYYLFGNVTSEEYALYTSIVDGIRGSGDFEIYRSDIGSTISDYFTIEAIKINTPTYCDDVLYQIFTDELVFPSLYPTFIDYGSYYIYETPYFVGTNSSAEFNFLSNGQNFSSITMSNNKIYFDDTLVYDSLWVDDYYRVIFYTDMQSAYIPSILTYNPILANFTYDPYYSYYLNSTDRREELNYEYERGYEAGETTGYNIGYEDGLEDNLTTNIFGNIVNTLDSLRLFDTISVLDIIITLIGLFVFVFVLKLIAGG